jgi:undecaprenyl-diphosphatase
VDDLPRNFSRAALAIVRRPRASVPRITAGAITAIVVTLVVIVALMFRLDVAASTWARHLPPWVTAAYDQITDFGLSGWFLYPLGFMLLCLAAMSSPKLSRPTQAVLAMLAVRFGFLFLAIGVPGLFVTIVKRLIGRARPYHIGNYDDPFAYMPFIWRSEYASMPSGHATTAASAAIAIGALWPGGRGVLWFYALVIMVSRVAVLAHHPSDVIAGALVGLVGAGLVRRWFAARRLVFSAVDLRAFPWPSFKRVRAAAGEVVASFRDAGLANGPPCRPSVEPGRDGL